MTQITTKNKRDFLHVVSSSELTAYSSPIEETHLVEKGCKVEGVNEFADLINWDSDTIATVIRTTKSSIHKNNNKRLNKQVTENVLELAKLCQLGILYFEDTCAWKRWLETPNIQFECKPPLWFVGSIRGRELIKYVIRRLQNGYTA
ncbi:hypothetical protein [Colwellia sp. E150_009]